MMDFVTNMVNELGPFKGLIIGTGVGIALAKVPFQRLGIKLSNLLLKLFGKEVAEKVEDKISKALLEFIQGMDDDEDVDIRLVRKSKKKGFFSRTIKSAEDTTEVIVEESNE